MQDRGVEKSLAMHRSIGPAELEQVRGLLAAHPDWSGYRLSRELRRVWNCRNEERVHGGASPRVSHGVRSVPIPNREKPALPIRRDSRPGNS
jgi:hypothetical protein